MTDRYHANLATESSLECVYVELTDVRIDPTANPPEFAVVDEGTLPGSGDWEVGTWDGVYDSSRMRITAVSPIIPTAFTVVNGEVYDVYVRVTLGGQQPERYAGELRVARK